MTYAEAWLAEMWPAVRELTPAERERQRLDEAVARERYGRPNPETKRSA